MKNVLVAGLDGRYGECVHFGTFEGFKCMRISRLLDMVPHIDSIGRGFVDDDTLSFEQFCSITTTPPHILVQTSAIICFSGPASAIQAISIAEHYHVPIVVTKDGIRMKNNKTCDLMSLNNLRLLKNMGKEMPTFYCSSDEQVVAATAFITEDGRKTGFYTVKDLD